MSTRTPLKPIGELCLQLKMLLNAESDRNVRGFLWRALHNCRAAAHAIARERYPIAYPPVCPGYLPEPAFNEPDMDATASTDEPDVSDAVTACSP